MPVDTGLDFKDLLVKQGFALEKIMVMRHSPASPSLRKVLPWLAEEKPAAFNAYQRWQNPDAEKALMKAGYVASFIGEGDKAILVGLYEQCGSNPVTNEQFLAIPALQELKPFGLTGIGERQTAQWFNLKLLNSLAAWKGRLIVKWPPGRLWWRWLLSNDFTVHAIHEESVFASVMPPWDQLRLTWADLKVLPMKWKDALRQWRAIYFIFDISDGKGYVGSAFGAENLLQRWLEYATTGHGGNSKLRQRNPDNFRFSVLQRPSQDLEKIDIERLESTWKGRLHTREYGLNDN